LKSKRLNFCFQQKYLLIECEFVRINKNKYLSDFDGLYFKCKLLQGQEKTAAKAQYAWVKA